MKVYGIFTTYGLGDDEETCFDLVAIRETLEEAVTYTRKGEITQTYFDPVHPSMMMSNYFTYIGKRTDCKETCRTINYWGGHVIELLDTEIDTGLYS